jgi:hypothetical protein
MRVLRWLIRWTGAIYAGLLATEAELLGGEPALEETRARAA